MAYAEKRGKYWRVRYKLPDGTWDSASRDDFGNRFATKILAVKYGRALETDVDRKVFINPQAGRITLEAWAKLWMESIELAPISERGYRSRLDAVILPKWGSDPVGDISAVSVKTWLKNLRLKYSSDHVQGIESLMRVMFDDAIQSKLRADNPVSSRRSGRRGKYKSTPREEKVIATPRQALLVARNALALYGLNEYAMVLTMAYTGFRIGEISAIRRDQLAFSVAAGGPRILMSQQGQYVGGEFTQIDPKYDSGRGLLIPEFLAGLLTELVASRPGSEWVFTGPNGGRLIRGGRWYSVIWESFVNGAGARPSGYGGACARDAARPVLGVAGLTPHGLRHSHKVWLDEAGHPKVAVEDRLGHVIPGVEGTYSHTTLGMEMKIAKSLEEIWEESLKPVVDRREFGPTPPPLKVNRS